MAEVKFLVDYRGHLTKEEFFTAGTVANFPDAVAIVLVADGRATYTSTPEIVDWTQVKGISDELANALLYMGLTSKAALLEYARDNTLTDIPGIGAKRAADLLQFAREE